MTAPHTGSMQPGSGVPKTLVVYFSLTGTTGVVARELAAALGAVIEQLEDPRFSSGLSGYLRLAHDHFRRNVTSHLQPVAYDPADFDLVVLGGPIWASRMCAPTMTYAREYRDRIRRVALFCTARSGKPGYAETCLNAMARETGLSPVALMGLSQTEAGQEHSPAIDHYAAKLRATLW